jgi:hypothetical protein
MPLVNACLCGAITPLKVLRACVPSFVPILVAE